MNKILEKANLICSNFNSGDFNVKLHPVRSAETLSKLYKSYNGPLEFLYISPIDEIQQAIDHGAIFLGAYVNSNLAGVVKISKLEFPYPFFVPPISLSKNLDYWGLSGMLISPLYRGQHLATILLDCGLKISEACNACGIYADFDYRNLASMRTISKKMSLLGYTDGRNGSPDEATIYTMFYKSFIPTKIIENFTIDFNKFTCDDAVQQLNKEMAKVGSFSCEKVEYCGGYNKIVRFDEPYTFEKTIVNISENEFNNLLNNAERIK